MKFQELHVYIQRYKEGGLKARVRMPSAFGHTYGSDLLKHHRTDLLCEAISTVIQELNGTTVRVRITCEPRLSNEVFSHEYEGCMHEASMDHQKTRYLFVASMDDFSLPV